MHVLGTSAATKALAQAASSTTSSSSSGTSSSSSGTGSTASLTSESTFLQLLVAQIKNQNPLNPTDSIQFVSQLVQYSELEQLMGINQGVQTLNGSTTSTTSSSGSSTTSTSGTSSS